MLNVATTRFISLSN